MNPDSLSNRKPNNCLILVIKMHVSTQSSSRKPFGDNVECLTLFKRQEYIIVSDATGGTLVKVIQCNITQIKDN